MQLTHPIKIRERVQYYALLDSPVKFDSGVCGAITGAFNKALISGEGRAAEQEAAGRRRRAWAWLLIPGAYHLQEVHALGLTPSEWNALYRWMGGSWHPNGMRAQFVAECRWVSSLAEEAFKLTQQLPTLTLQEIIDSIEIEGAVVS